MVPGPGAEPLQGHEAIAESLRPLVGLGETGSFTGTGWSRTVSRSATSLSYWSVAPTPRATPPEVHGVTTEVLRRRADGTWEYVIDHPFGGSD